MKNYYRLLATVLVILFVKLMAVNAAQNHEESVVINQEQAVDSTTNYIQLSSKQMELAEIRLEKPIFDRLDYQLIVPAEIKVNGYTSHIISPRVDSVVLQRHVSLGEVVKKEQALVTLYSEDMADAQADYRVEYFEWIRLKKLDRNTLSESDYRKAKIQFEAATGRLKVLGLTDTVISQLHLSTQPLGEYTLYAQSESLVIKDEFKQGQSIQAGQSLLLLSNESELWVEARLEPQKEFIFSTDLRVSVMVNNLSYPAKVIQQGHLIDLSTRTQIVRLLVDNKDHQLHPGMFADVVFKFKTKTPVLAVPKSALICSLDGDWLIFVENKPGKFEAQEVELGREFNDFMEIKGISTDKNIVISGVFFVNSQMIKHGFDPHNH